MLDHCDDFNHNAKVRTKKSRRKNYSVGWELVGVANSRLQTNVPSRSMLRIGTAAIPQEWGYNYSA